MINQEINTKKMTNDKLIKILSSQISKLPDINFRQSKKITSKIIELSAKYNSFNIDNSFTELFDILGFLKEHIKECNSCHYFMIDNFCEICSNSIKKNQRIICIVENFYEYSRLKDIGENFSYDFHIIGGIISISNGFLPKDLNLQSLLKKIKSEERDIKEIVIAINKSYDGMLTCNYIASFLKENLSDKIKNNKLKITTLADGLPSGVSNFDFIDNKTLEISFQERKEVVIYE